MSRDKREVVANAIRSVATSSDGVVRAALERELRRSGRLQDGSHLACGWLVGLLGLKINDVDCTEREGGRTLMRALRRMNGGAAAAMVEQKGRASSGSRSSRRRLMPKPAVAHSRPPDS